MSLETLTFGSESEVRKSDFPIDSNLPLDWGKVDALHSN